MKLRTITLLIAASFSISCAGFGSNPKLDLPPELIVPSISADEVKCLPDNVFNKIKRRDKLKSARIETLKNIIRSTH